MRSPVYSAQITVMSCVCGLIRDEVVADLLPLEVATFLECRNVQVAQGHFQKPPGADYALFKPRIGQEEGYCSAPVWGVKLAVIPFGY